jgi:NADH-quinone oxidoreductase subunit L
LSERVAAILACSAIGLAFVSAIVAATGAGTPKSVFNYDWTVAGSWKVSVGLLADPLSTFMALIVTGVGFLIHVYSIGYMAGEENYRRFFAYLNLFVFAMLLLVTADNFVLLMIGWGGVGLSSFLLIGFYTERISAVQAARKAFVINTIGDVGLLLGVFTILYNSGGTISYAGVFASPNLVGAGTDHSWINWAAALLFVACAAKSAQLPLHTWLADAMEGPTPVSALIHAATMVTAGVYLVCRAAPIFGRSEVMLVVIPLIGAVTAIYAATCALGQFDLKRVLAYSTVSQLGYMFMAAGTGAYQAALFHLMTHAFFKALLFLAAGAVIHGLGGEQDMRKMGALGSKMPLARIVFLIGALAISGIPPFAGFFSKEAILGTFPLLGDSNPGITSGLGTAGQALVGWVGIITALLTAFYMFRAYFMVFEGREVEAHVHPIGQTMAVPLMVLGLLSTVGGFLLFPGLWNGLNDYFKGLFATAPYLTLPNAKIIAPPTDGIEWPNLIIALVAGLLGIGLAFGVYQRVWRNRPTTIEPVTGLRNFLLRAWFFDTLYNAVFVATFKALGSLAAHGIEPLEQKLVDSGIGGGIWGSSRIVRRTETGFVRNYALVMMFGVVAILVYVAIVGL